MTYPFPGIDWTDFIADDHERRPKRLSDLPGDQIFLIAHHSYSYTVGSILNTFKSASRTVTANLAIGPMQRGDDDYKCVHTVEIDRDRAYTTASSMDKVAITFEMANLSLDPPYKVGMTGKQIAAHLAAWMHVHYGMPLTRWHVTCHREVYERGWGSYATSCPGDDLHRALDWIVSEAKKLVASGLAGLGSTPVPKETKVKFYHNEDATARSTGRVVQPGNHFYLNTVKGAEADKASNVVGGIGTYSLTPHIYVEGEPGDEVEVKLLWDDTKTSGPHSPHYIERVEIGPKGFARRSFEFKRGVAAGEAVYAQCRAVETNKASVKVTVFDVDAFLFVAA